jgi:hypothetical protein
MNPDYAIILTRRYPNKQWTLNGDDYDGLTWLDEGNPPSKTELDALWSDVQAEIVNEKQAKETARAAVLAKLGLTAEEVAVLLA